MVFVKENEPSGLLVPSFPQSLFAEGDLERKMRLRTPKKKRNKKTGTGVVATVEIMSRPKFLRNLNLGWHLLIEIYEIR